ADEIEQAVAGLPADTRFAVFGCGGTVPATLPVGSSIMDFDQELVEQAARGGRHTPYHTIGMRTLLADQSVDVVVITSRLSGLWDEWREELLTEAHRIGRKVIGPW